MGDFINLNCNNNAALDLHVLTCFHYFFFDTVSFTQFINSILPINLQEWHVKCFHLCIGKNNAKIWVLLINKLHFQQIFTVLSLTLHCDCSRYWGHSRKQNGTALRTCVCVCTYIHACLCVSWAGHLTTSNPSSVPWRH